MAPQTGGVRLGKLACVTVVSAIIRGKFMLSGSKTHRCVLRALIQACEPGTVHLHTDAHAHCGSHSLLDCYSIRPVDKSGTEGGAEPKPHCSLRKERSLTGRMLIESGCRLETCETGTQPDWK